MRTFDLWLAIKGVLLIFTFGYFLFSIVVLRQVQVMNRVLQTSLSSWIKFFGFCHFFFALGVFLWILFFC